MNTIEQTAGNAYTRDPDYAKFTGRVVQTFSTVYYDPEEKVFIKRTVEYIDLGRPDTVTPVDCEEAIADTGEELEGEPRRAPLIMQKRTLALSLIVNELLKDRAMTAAAIAAAIDRPYQRIDVFMREHDDLYTVTGYFRGKRLYGLSGKTYTDWRDSRTEQVNAYLREYGPSTLDEIAEGTGLSRTKLDRHIRQYGGTVYVQVGKGKHGGLRWNLA